ncbi:hypothetical protein B0H19DRAFT_1199554 [Mycena capillaripes]|nr:hypothetical protein B0H19DRAFT_1199554 [Mycena capillaripes]
MTAGLMAKVPRWPGLKYFENVTSKDINDGQSWLDIEKCILPCVVQLLPKNSPFVHAIRTHLLTRMMMMGLHCISEEQIKRKSSYQEDYGKYCKHSITPHLIRNKGPHSIYCTRINECFRQECREIYARLNKRDLDKQGGTDIFLQMTDLDAIREAMSLIRMTVNQYVNHEERFDCKAINMDDNPLTFGRMLFLFQCRLPSGRNEDIAFVRLFKNSTWRP